MPIKESSCQIVCSLKYCMHTLIIDFCVSRQFDSFAKLEGYMEKYWQLMDMGDFNMVGHESGQLLNIVIPTMELQPGSRDIRSKDYSDDYGVLGG